MESLQVTGADVLQIVVLIAAVLAHYFRTRERIIKVEEGMERLKQADFVRRDTHMKDIELMVSGLDHLKELFGEMNRQSDRKFASAFDLINRLRSDLMNSYLTKTK